MGKLMNPDIRRKCTRCGREYHPTSSRQQYCNQTIEYTCVVCGHKFESVCGPYEPKTCSQDCQTSYTKALIDAKSEQILKKCAWCGKEFHPKTTRSKYCNGPHYQTCCVCGKQFEIVVPDHKDRLTCSPECKKVLSLQNRDIDAEKAHQKETLLKKYGVENSMQIPGSKDKIKQTNLERYGHEWYTQTDDYKEAVRCTSLEKYGEEHFLSSPEIIAKRQETCVAVYGCDNASKSPEVIEKIQTTMQDKYGVMNYGQAMIPNMAEWNKFKQDPRTYIQNKYFGKPSRMQLCTDLGVSINAVYDYMTQDQRDSLLSESFSRMEEEVCNFLQSFCPDIQIIHNDRSIISPYEIDIYLPEYRIGIECDPTYTHNSSLVSPWGDPPKPQNYHQTKTDLCDQKDVFLFHIFGYDWTHSRPIIESMLRNVIRKNTTTIYARKTEIKEVSYPEACEFLIENHRQGDAQSSVRLGLYIDEELVSLMTFTKLRNLGKRASDSTVQASYELVRFCNKLNTSVVGGASKLFNQFVKQYNPLSILSYSDRAHTRGNLYLQLGFQQERRSAPGYVWVNLKTDEAVNRMRCQKKNIHKLFPEESVDTSKSESQIMTDHNFVKVCDSGTITWVWSR